MKKFLKFIWDLILIAFMVAMIIGITYILKENMETSTTETIENNTVEQSNVTKEASSAIKDVGIDKYYYNQLDNAGKIFYQNINNNINNMKTGDYVIEFEKNELNDIIKQEGGEDIVIEAFHSAWMAFVYDNTDAFYLDINKIDLTIEYKKSLLSTKYNIKIGPSENGNYLAKFDTNDNLQTIINKIESKKNNIISTLSGSDYNKVKQVHDWLVKNVEYDQTNSMNQYDIYGALIRGKAVCEGYAESLKYILDGVGIESVIVSGEATNGNGQTDLHAWNYVKLDGKWYGIDVSWDDPVIIGGGSLSNSEKYQYFCRSRAIFAAEHKENGRLTEKGMLFSYPKLSESDYR